MHLHSILHTFKGMMECRKSLAELSKITDLNPCVIQNRFDTEVVFIATENTIAMRDNQLSMKKNEVISGENFALLHKGTGSIMNSLLKFLTYQLIFSVLQIIQF